MKVNEKYLVVVSGPSGSGKDTVVKELISRRPDMNLAVSCTSRGKRDYEQDGEHYFFVSREEFLRRVSKGGMLEYTEYSGNYYGTPLDEIENRIDNEETVILVIEVNGAKRVKELFPDSLLVFVVPPSLDELDRRLRLRNTESEVERGRRMEIAQVEMSRLADYDRVIENDIVENCAVKLEKCIEEWQRGH